MHRNLNKSFVLEERRVLIEKHNDENNYLYIYTSPQSGNKINPKFSNYQLKIGVSWAYIIGCDFRLIEEETMYSNCLVQKKMIDFCRFLYENKIKVKRIFIYDLKILSKRKVARDFILFYFIDVLGVELYTKDGLFRKDMLNLRSKRLINMLIDYEMFNALIIGKSRINVADILAD